MIPPTARPDGVLARAAGRAEPGQLRRRLGDPPQVGTQSLQ